MPLITVDYTETEGNDFSDDLCAIMRAGSRTPIQKGTSYNLIPTSPSAYEVVFTLFEKFNTLTVTGGLYGTMKGYKKDGTEVIIASGTSPQTVDISEFVYILWTHASTASGRTYVFN